jgi:hypothetical protein
LTFDADMTPAMLRRLQSGAIGSYYNSALIDELRKRRVPATLFLTGLWMQHYPDVMRELAADPLFELGTHTWQHRAFTTNCYGLPTGQPSQMLNDVLGRSGCSTGSPETAPPGCSAFPAAAMTPPLFEQSRRPASRQCSSTSRPGTGSSRTQVP